MSQCEITIVLAVSTAFIGLLLYVSWFFGYCKGLEEAYEKATKIQRGV